MIRTVLVVLAVLVGAGVSAVTGVAPALAQTEPDGQRICKVDTGHGVYYLLVNSATWHDFSVCGANPEAFGSNIDTMLATPSVDRRCFLPVAARDRSTSAVYSGAAPADLAAAREFCASSGGTN